MSQFVVHSMPGSPYGRAVFAALEEKHADYRLAPVTPESSKLEPHLSGIHSAACRYSSMAI